MADDERTTPPITTWRRSDGIVATLRQAGARTRLRVLSGGARG